MLQRPAIVNGVAKRTLAATAHATQANAKSNQPQDAVVKTSRTSSGVLVTSIDRHGPLSNVSVAFRAGSRYENVNNLGASHRLRDLVGLSSPENAAFELLWRAGVVGANVNSYTTRDLFVSSVQAWRDYSVPAMEVLGQMVTPGLREWELKDTNPRMAYERQLLKCDPAARAFDLLHAAAYRSGSLGYSTVTPKYMIGKHRAPMMREYINARMVASEACIVGVNVDHDQLFNYAQSTSIAQGAGGAPSASPYLGGDVRKLNGSPLTHVMIAGATHGVNNAKATATAAVFGALMADGPATQHATNCGTGLVSRAFSSALTGENSVSPLHCAHSDSGLVGVHIVADSANIDTAVRTAVKAMREAGQKVDDKHLQNAKKAAVTMALAKMETDTALVEDAISQTLSGQEVVSTADGIIKAINDVTSADVQALAKQVMGKPTLSAVGNVLNVPYLDTL